VLKKIIVIVIVTLLTQSCVMTTNVKKSDYSPKMYQQKPLSIVVLPPINKTTAADAKDFFSTTITECFANTGYYVPSTEIVNDILKQEGAWDTETMNVEALKNFKTYMGADAVLITTINEWTTNYYVIGGSVAVGIDFVVRSTASGEILWQYAFRKEVDTTQKNNGGGLAGLAVSLIATAINTAATQYVPIAIDVNNESFTAIPAGKYHPKSNKDGDDIIIVNKEYYDKIK